MLEHSNVLLAWTPKRLLLQRDRRPRMVMHYAEKSSILLKNIDFLIPNQYHQRDLDAQIHQQGYINALFCQMQYSSPSEVQRFEMDAYKSRLQHITPLQNIDLPPWQIDH